MDEYRNFMIDKGAFGSRLKQYRKNERYSQQGLADAIGTSRVCVSNWECGKALPTLDVTYRLARILKVSINDLVGFAPAGRRGLYLISDRAQIGSYKHVRMSDTRRGGGQ